MISIIIIITIDIILIINSVLIVFNKEDKEKLKNK